LVTSRSTIALPRQRLLRVWPGKHLCLERRTIMQRPRLRLTHTVIIAGAIGLALVASITAAGAADGGPITANTPLTVYAICAK
jgi:hypothetical protein